MSEVNLVDGLLMPPYVADADITFLSCGFFFFFFFPCLFSAVIYWMSTRDGHETSMAETKTRPRR